MNKRLDKEMLACVLTIILGIGLTVVSSISLANKHNDHIEYNKTHQVEQNHLVNK